MKTRFFHMVRKKSLVTNKILLFYSLKHTIMITGLKMINWLMQQETVIKKFLDLSHISLLEA